MRKAITTQVQTQVLIRCKRRCALCFGLNRDVSIKKGQIAHLDQDNSNNAVDNLVYLCLDHHNEYDSVTRQSKNLTLAEVRHYRNEIEEQIELAWKEPVAFNITPLLDLTGISGHYVWETGNASAEVDIRALGNNKISVTGIALWGTRNANGPNIGELDFTATLSGDKLYHKDPHSDYEMTITFTFDGLSVREKNAQGEFGMNVTFAGEFIKKEIETAQPQVVPEKNVTIFLRNGNIFSQAAGKEKQLSFCSADSDPMRLGNGKILFIRYEQGIRPSIEDENETYPYRRHKIMTVDPETLLEETVTDRKPFTDGVDATNEILRIGNPTISPDSQYLYFVTEKYTTAHQFVKVEIESGKWIELFSAESFELIPSGPHRNLFLVATSEIRNRGRDIYYKLCDEQGKVYKDFDSEESLMKFRQSL